MYPYGWGVKYYIWNVFTSMI